MKFKVTCFAVLFGACASFLMAKHSPPPVPKPALLLKVHITNIPTADGLLLLTLSDSETSFLDDSKAVYRVILPVDRLTEEGIWLHLPAGSYAVAIVHDLNANHAFDRNFLGVPVEPFGFSNNPSIFFGPPSWEDAKLVIEAAVTEITIKLKTS